MTYTCEQCTWRSNGEFFANRHQEENLTHIIVGGTMKKETKMEIVRTLNQDKETKGAVRYKDADGLTIYLRKNEVNFPNQPAQIRIVITEAA